MINFSLWMEKQISWCVIMIKKLHAMSVYDYVDMLCKEIGCEWSTNIEGDIFLTKQHLYNQQDNTKYIAKNKRKI